MRGEVRRPWQNARRKPVMVGGGKWPYGRTWVPKMKEAESPGPGNRMGVRAESNGECTRCLGFRLACMCVH